MLKRLYVDNYKCLVNFEYKPGKLQLILGGNGTGKSSVFEVLALLRSFLLDGTTTKQLFHARTLTRWHNRTKQTFEIDIDGNGGVYHYNLIIEFLLQENKNRVFHEELSFNGNPIFISNLGEAQLFRDDNTQAMSFLLDWSRSGFTLLSERSDNARLNWFLDWVSHLYCFQIDPHQMLSMSDQEEVTPQQNLANYASWYRHLIQEEPNTYSTLRVYLKHIFDDFDSLSLMKLGENSRILKAEFDSENVKNVKFDFEELSDGQRTLIGLYTLLAVMKEKPMTLCIDEPDNFIMLAEIQPWLMELQDVSEEHGSQVLLISHHPELINMLVPIDAIHFSRENGGPTRVKPFTTEGKGSLPPAEIIARGWDNE